jgi:hypothetical protein
MAGYTQLIASRTAPGTVSVIGFGRAAGSTVALFGMLAADRGLSDAFAQRFPVSTEVTEACRRGFAHAEQIISRAHDSGQLRPDFQLADLVSLTWAISQVIRESAASSPDAWRRCLAFFLDGLRTEAAHGGAAPPLTSAQLAKVGQAENRSA